MSSFQQCRSLQREAGQVCACRKAGEQILSEFFPLLQAGQSFPLLQALSSVRLRATGKPTFSSSSPKPRVNVHPERRKPTPGLLFRTNSCSNRRLFSLVEPTRLFITSQCFISTLAALGGRGSSRTSGIKSSAEHTEQAWLCTCRAAGGKLTSEQGHTGCCGRGMNTCHKVWALGLPEAAP